MLHEVGSPWWWMVASKAPSGAAVARADITVTHLATAGTTTNATSFATASITPTANRLVLAWVTSRVAAAGIPTASGNGLTWVQVATIADGSGGIRLTVFRAMGASPSAGAVTFDFGGVSQTSCCWSIAEYGSVDTSGTNGIWAVVQSVTKTTAAGTSDTNTLAALENAKNVHVCGNAIMANEAQTPDADFAELGDANAASNAIGLETQWAANQLPCTVTWTTSAANVMISIEVKAGTA